jgi:hypothetical protein
MARMGATRIAWGDPLTTIADIACSLDYGTFARWMKMAHENASVHRELENDKQ